ncbi:BrnT family toxin [Marinobacter sp. CA1]|nr:BrnT family toxin [Marinobacter sp. CA1]
MDIDFDSAKDAANREKHGVSLSEAAGLEWDTLVFEPDTRHDYGEERYVGFALRGDRLYCVVFTDRAGVRRIISLRKANSREVKRYADKN